NLSYADDIQFTGGNVTCDGGYGYGMKLKNASLYIEDGEVTAKGQRAAFDLYNDATVTAALYQGSLNYDGSDSEMTTQFNPEWKNVFASGKQLYTMSFEANGGTGEMESVMVVEGETFSLPTCGFTPPSGDAQFYGWEVSGSDQMYHEGDMIDDVSEDMTFTATWFEPIIMDYVAAAFDGKLGMAFYVSLPECLKYDQNAYVTFTQNGETTKKPLAGVFESGKNASGLYRIAFYMPAAYYRDQVTMRFFDGNDELLKIKGKSTGNDLTSTGVNYSLEKYVNKIKNNPDEKVKNLARAMDDYCTAAQIYFEHPTAGVTLTLSSAVSGVTQSQLEGYKAVRNGSLPSSITGVTLTASFEADNTLKLGLNFKENKKPSGIKYYISEDGTFDHAKATSVRGDATNGYHLAVRNVPAAYLGKSYTFFIVNEKDTSSNNMYSIRCSIFTYARATAFNSTYSENLRNLTKAMYLYGKAAEAYFNVTN
ncbi:MAG: hypothetical protein J6Z22_09965, partial [Lachnospiraceae bacterium]|nr:hypothetical protein [Lachnospiraceae bacterium]